MIYKKMIREKERDVLTICIHSYYRGAVGALLVYGKIKYNIVPYLY